MYISANLDGGPNGVGGGAKRLEQRRRLRTRLEGTLHRNKHKIRTTAEEDC